MPTFDTVIGSKYPVGPFLRNTFRACCELLADEGYVLQYCPPDRIFARKGKVKVLFFLNHISNVYLSCRFDALDGLSWRTLYRFKIALAYDEKTYEDIMDDGAVFLGRLHDHLHYENIISLSQSKEVPYD